MLVVYGMRFTADAVTSEDLVQDVFVEMWQRQLVFVSEIALKAYLYNSVRNKAISLLRHEQVKENYRGLVAQEPNSSNEEEEEDWITEEVYRQLFEQIDKLPERQRKTFLLAMEGHNNAEIAQIMSVSIDTVKTQKRRATAVLRSKLGDKKLMLVLMGGI
jgi:RNA polymerase sigma-70 factor (family 1)